MAKKNSRTPTSFNKLVFLKPKYEWKESEPDWQILSNYPRSTLDLQRKGFWGEGIKIT